MKAIELLFKQFESFVKRAVMPSISFGFIFYVEYLLFNSYINKENIDLVDITKNIITLDSLTIIILVVMLIGLSYFLSILQQLIFDNFIKKDYNGLLLNDENSQLDGLRKKVINKLKNKLDFIDEKTNDYFLYQAIGRELAYFDKQTNTSRYVDDTKSIGIFFTSLIMINIFLLTISWTTAIVIVIIYILGYQAIKSKYRSRAIRMYINYLLGENKT